MNLVALFGLLCPILADYMLTWIESGDNYLPLPDIEYYCSTEFAQGRAVYCSGLQNASQLYPNMYDVVTPKAGGGVEIVAYAGFVTSTMFTSGGMLLTPIKTWGGTLASSSWGIASGCDRTGNLVLDINYHCDAIRTNNASITFCAGNPRSTSTWLTNPASFRACDTPFHLVCIAGPLSPTSAPTLFPTQAPTFAPTPPNATLVPTTNKPTQVPTLRPTRTPTRKPTQPTQKPTQKPTLTPTQKPTLTPTQTPTQTPTRMPTHQPTKAPTKSPVTRAPTFTGTTMGPTSLSAAPTTQAPTSFPTKSPTSSPTTELPTSSPTTELPTSSPTTESPTSSPTTELLSSPPTTSMPTTISPTTATPTGFPTFKSPSTAPSSFTPNAPFPTASTSFTPTSVQPPESCRNRTINESGSTTLDDGSTIIVPKFGGNRTCDIEVQIVRILSTTYSGANSCTNNSSPTVPVVAVDSNVIRINLRMNDSSCENSHNLSEPIQFLMPQSSSHSCITPQCVWWSGTQWESTGCTAQALINATLCTCTHLTDFAVILDKSGCGFSSSYYVFVGLYALLAVFAPPSFVMNLLELRDGRLPKCMLGARLLLPVLVEVVSLLRIVSILGMFASGPQLLGFFVSVIYPLDYSLFVIYIIFVDSSLQMPAQRQQRHQRYAFGIVIVIGICVTVAFAALSPTTTRVVVANGITVLLDVLLFTAFCVLSKQMGERENTQTQTQNHSSSTAMKQLKVVGYVISACFLTQAVSSLIAVVADSSQLLGWTLFYLSSNVLALILLLYITRPRKRHCCNQGHCCKSKRRDPQLLPLKNSAHPNNAAQKTKLERKKHSSSVSVSPQELEIARNNDIVEEKIQDQELPSISELARETKIQDKQDSSNER